MDDIASRLKSLLPRPKTVPALPVEGVRAKRQRAEKAAAKGAPNAEQLAREAAEHEAEYAERLSSYRNKELTAANIVASGFTNYPASFISNQDRELQAAVARRAKERLEAADITAGRVMHAIGRIAFADIRKAFADDGSMVPINQLDDDIAMAISSVDAETKVERTADKGMRSVTTVKKLRMSDRMSALTLLAKHFKLVGDEGDGVNALASALADRLDRAQKRVQGVLTPEPVEDATVREPASPQPRSVGYSGDSNP